jgi:hypothetical protein
VFLNKKSKKRMLKPCDTPRAYHEAAALLFYYLFL